MRLEIAKTDGSITDSKGWLPIHQTIEMTPGENYDEQSTFIPPPGWNVPSDDPY
jgi:hypothetical protein